MLECSVRGCLEAESQTEKVLGQHSLSRLKAAGLYRQCVQNHCAISWKHTHTHTHSREKNPTTGLKQDRLTDKLLVLLLLAPQFLIMFISSILKFFLSSTVWLEQRLPIDSWAPGPYHPVSGKAGKLDGWEKSFHSQIRQLPGTDQSVVLAWMEARIIWSPPKKHLIFNLSRKG